MRAKGGEARVRARAEELDKKTLVIKDVPCGVPHGANWWNPLKGQWFGKNQEGNWHQLLTWKSRLQPGLFSRHYHIYAPCPHGLVRSGLFHQCPRNCWLWSPIWVNGKFCGLTPNTCRNASGTGNWEGRIAGEGCTLPGKRYSLKPHLM